MSIMVKDFVLRKCSKIVLLIVLVTASFSISIDLYGAQKQNSLADLSKCIENNQIEKVKELLKDVAFVNKFISSQEGACAARVVYRSARYNQLKLLKLLLDEKQLSIKDTFERCQGGYFARLALDVATNNKHQDIVRYLVKKISFSRKQLEFARRIAAVNVGMVTGKEAQKRLDQILVILEEAINAIDVRVTNNLNSIVALLAKKKSWQKLEKLVYSVNSKINKD